MNNECRHDWRQARELGPIVALAPMDGYTDSAYRQVGKIVAPGCYVFCEFVSSDGLSRAKRKMSRLVQYNPEVERPYTVQMFGKQPEAFVEAAKFLVDELGVDAIDINFGCPAKKVVGSGHGSDLIRHPTVAEDIIKSLKDAIDVPVSFKTRLGWQDDSTLQDFVGVLFAAGADMCTIHGRTVKQGYSGVADWEPIYALKRAFLDQIILGNGDITSGQVAKDKLGNLDGVMIGRATFGNPWVLQEVYAALHGEDWTPPTLDEQTVIIRKHAELLIEAKGERRAMMEFRKHLLSFTKGFPGARELRGKMTSIESMDDVEAVIAAIAAQEYSTAG